jgi:hypothetical protein
VKYLRRDFLKFFWLLVGACLGSGCAVVALFHDSLLASDPLLFNIEETEQENGVQVYKMLVWNRTGKELTIVGSQVSCNCVAIDGLPAVVGPHQSIRLSPRIRASTGGKGVSSFHTVTYFVSGRGVGLEKQVVKLGSSFERSW